MCCQQDIIGIISQITAVEDLESSRSLVRLNLLAGPGVRADLVERWTFNEQTCKIVSLT